MIVGRNCTLSDLNGSKWWFMLCGFIKEANLAARTPKVPVRQESKQLSSASAVRSSSTVALGPAPSLAIEGEPKEPETETYRDFQEALPYLDWLVAVDLPTLQKSFREKSYANGRRMFLKGMNKLTECVSGRMRDLLNVNGELWNPIALDQVDFRFQFQNQSERSQNKWTSYVCVSKKGAMAFHLLVPFTQDRV